MREAASAPTASPLLATVQRPSGRRSTCYDADALESRHLSALNAENGWIVTVEDNYTGGLDAREPVLRDLFGRAEKVGVILRELAHPHQPVQRAVRRVAVAAAIF